MHFLHNSSFIVVVTRPASCRAELERSLTKNNCIIILPMAKTGLPVAQEQPILLEWRVFLCVSVMDLSPSTRSHAGMQWYARG